MVAETMVAEVMAELAELEDPKIREVNDGHGDDHGDVRGRWFFGAVAASAGCSAATSRPTCSPQAGDY